MHKRGWNRCKRCGGDRLLRWRRGDVDVDEVGDIEVDTGYLL
jgi:hypothetical protein